MEQNDALKNGNIFLTGGAGTLGRAIAERRFTEGWKGKLTVFSRDTTKHSRMRVNFPDVNYVCGDVRNYDNLYAAMAGHDVVIHAAAVKVIPVSEYDSADTIDVNVIGSMNVCKAAVQLGVNYVMGISTDKAAHPVNAYGATKMLMEKVFAEYARKKFKTEFYLVRYGNVLESTGSVIEAWNKAVDAGQPVTITDDSMTRFWLSPSQAVDVIEKGFSCLHNGCIYVPKMPALSIKKLAEYTLPEGTPLKITGVRPGEKMHEDLVTEEERKYTDEFADYYMVFPSTNQSHIFQSPMLPFSSDVARELSKDELMDLLEG